MSIYTPSGDDTVRGDERAKPKVPLDEEWVALARKMLTGADPEERLTWRTPEVCGGEGEGLVVPLPLWAPTIHFRHYNV